MGVILKLYALYLADKFEEIHNSMTNYLHTGHVNTPSRGRGMQQAKTNSRYLEDEEEELPLESNVVSMHKEAGLP